jgi:GT2 family glycosyltransferase
VIYFLVVNYYSGSLVERLRQSLFSLSINYHVVVVNNSTDENLTFLKQYGSISIISAFANLGFAKACNLGLNWIYAQDNSAVVWLINPDAYLRSESFKNLNIVLDYLERISILGTIIYTQESQVWFAGGYSSSKSGEIYSKTDLFETDYQSCDWVSGCSLILNLANFCQCPQFDQAYFLYYEDFEFCRRYACLGHSIFITKLLAVNHQASSITNRNLTSKYKHSTYSYLLTLQRYTSLIVFSARLIRLFVHALFLLLVKPAVGKGKLQGMLDYCKFASKSI